MNSNPSLYKTVLGPDFDTLAPVLQCMHQGGNTSITLTGELRVRWSTKPWLRALLHVSPMPAPAQAAPCQATITPKGGKERWCRMIGGSTLTSQMEYAGPAHIAERMGPLKLELKTWISHSGHLRQASRKVTLCGIPLRWIRVIASERAIDAHRYACDVRIVLGRIGCVLRYDGTLMTRDATTLTLIDENPHHRG